MFVCLNFTISSNFSLIISLFFNLREPFILCIVCVWYHKESVLVVRQPRSQGLSSLPPLVVGRKDPGCGWSRAKLWHKLLHRGTVTNNFCRSQLKRKKGPSFEIFQSCCKLHTGQMRYINLYISSISAGRRPVCLLLEVKLFRCFMLPELTELKVHCSLNKTVFY